MILDKLPNGFWKVNDVVERLKKHTAKHPVFDLEQIVDDVDYWQVARNARLGVMAQNNKTKEFYRIGSIYAVIETTHDLEVLKYEVKRAYARVSGKNIEPEKRVRAITTTVDDLDGTDPQPRRQKKATTKYGEKLKSGKISNQQLEG